MNTHKVSVKLYLDKGQDVAPETWFRIFNAWISNHQGTDVLIDVADYSHVPAGPVALLVGHEYDICIDDSDQKRGLLYRRKQPVDGGFGSQLEAAIRSTCEICRRLETDTELGNQVVFCANDMRIVLNDRLNAPNSEETLNAIRADVNALLNRLYAGAAVVAHRRENARERFTLDVSANGHWTVESLLKNL
jgi:hypothetical protein